MPQPFSGQLGRTFTSWSPCTTRMCLFRLPFKHTKPHSSHFTLDGFSKLCPDATISLTASTLVSNVSGEPPMLTGSPFPPLDASFTTGVVLTNRRSSLPNTFPVSFGLTEAGLMCCFFIFFTNGSSLADEESSTSSDSSSPGRVPSEDTPGEGQRTPGI